METTNTFKAYDILMAKMYEQSLKSAQTLEAQYKKEREDAFNGTGLCAGMNKRERDFVASRLSESIKNKREEINYILEQIKCL